ncbi:putative signaling protein [Methylobacterium symbioticum]|uniref:Putative signaling protein n=2 Tax=Methylobacterium symbioticum TaxID=2584084 RepID=A0A509EA02_9HYPH|nr:putative signaling protein [Methylobacterium symbioticum]
MYRMFSCLVDQHAAWVVPLAGLVCWVSLHTALQLNRQSLDSEGTARRTWLLAASFCAGAGIWCTHFIGMLGYDPGLSIDYRIDGTLLSLLIAVLAVLAALVAVRAGSGLLGAALAALILGPGIAAMHVVGMLSIQVPGLLAWDRPMLCGAVAGGCVLAAAAFAIHRHPRLGRSRLLVASVLTASVAVLHFTAMAAVEVVPDLTRAAAAPSIPRLALSAGITAIMLSILGFGVLALFADRMRRANAALRASEAALRLSEERLALAVDADGLWEITLATGEMWLSDRWFTMLGYEPGELHAHTETWERLVHPEDRAGTQRLLTDHLEGRSPVYECEHRLLRKDGDWCWVLARGKVVTRTPCGRPLRIVGLQFDTTVRREAERQIAHMALHDALTGLPNRVLFRERLNDQFARMPITGNAFAVLACDLDRFKAVNDTYGHPAGDALLKVIAQRLRSVLRATDTIARLGGDEFAIILGQIDGPQSAEIVAQRLIEAVERPVDLGSFVAGVGISIGIATAPEERDADDLFKKADIALYRAKAEGRNTFRYYAPDMDAGIAGRSGLERDLRAGLRAGEFQLHYQPVFGAEDADLRGFEALLRWQHPGLGPISPAEFIPIAEESGQIVPLGEWALREACRMAAHWPDDLRVSVNVSAVQLRQPGLEQAVIDALAAASLAATRLELEITESVLIRDSEASMACLHRLRALGVRIALDDFGTGYSSLSYLRRFPFDRIKIDRSFIRDIADPDTAAIVRAIVGIGSRLGAAVTAEGVETADQLRQVRDQDCTEIQGFLFGRPMPAEEAVRLIEGRAALRAA